ncbi:McrB family protein [Cupriavidus alkaliphilus]|uniref:McrB family protein n=1 Tax=Cupriavidus alkaliphilus TaxID=942866 RepID=UPI00182E72A8|nr:AAA family ATPase [Cupriavidus alkaliphilus]MBB3015951.1 hypothetical protein [Cupriavidus alkaliphilus]
MNNDEQEIASNLRSALQKLAQASPQDSSKGNATRLWFKNHFGVEGRASLVNEPKQAYNRPKEQLGKRDVSHVIFLLASAKAADPLIRTVKSIVYPELKTVLLLELQPDGDIRPIMLLRNGSSTLETFYTKEFPDLKVEPLMPIDPSRASATDSHHKDSANSDGRDELVVSELAVDDVVLARVQALLADGYAGVIFTGAPGTSKSWYARQISCELVRGQQDRMYFVQFHPGYQYEDFIESYIPNSTGGFDLQDKIFVTACKRAREVAPEYAVLVIDEFSRTDAVRVFGEALTYLEVSKRELEFNLSSGKRFRIPRNLVILCTMNPWDRGVDELDLALERRFAKIDFEPNVDSLRAVLAKSELDGEKRGKLEQFFYMISKHNNVLCRIGHAYFSRVSDIDSLHRLWENQLSFHFKRILRNDPEELTKVATAWSRIFAE